MKRLLILVMALSLLSLTGEATLSAQSPDPRCISLMEADCTVFVEALTTMQGIGNFNNPAFSLTLGGGGGHERGQCVGRHGVWPHPSNPRRRGERL
jgi:hypothetical protein